MGFGNTSWGALSYEYSLRPRLPLWFFGKMVATADECFSRPFSVRGLVYVVYRNYLSKCVIIKVHQNTYPVLSVVFPSFVEISGAWKGVVLMSLWGKIPWTTEHSETTQLIIQINKWISLLIAPLASSSLLGYLCSCPWAQLLDLTSLSLNLNLGGGGERATEAERPFLRLLTPNLHECCNGQIDRAWWSACVLKTSEALVCPEFSSVPQAKPDSLRGRGDEKRHHLPRKEELFS